MLSTEPITTLPEWDEAQKALDLQRIAELAGKDVNTRLEVSDLVARVIPMACRGGNGDAVTQRAALLAHASGYSHAMIDVFRRVGSRWLTEQREQVGDCVINWTAIVEACSRTAKEGGVDPIKVLVALCQDSPVVSRADYLQALEEAIERSIPTPDGPDPEEPMPEISDLIEAEPDIHEPTAIDNLNDLIDSGAGKAKAADVHEVKEVGAEVLLLETQAAAALSKFQAVKDMEFSKPVRDELISLVKSIVAKADITADEVFGGSESR